MSDRSTAGIPVRVWGSAPDDETMRQARNLAALPFARGRIVLLPDAHVGYGMPIGAVLAADGQVIPHAVGLDIGCGVRAWRTGVAAGEIGPALDAILHDVLRSVPQGRDWHSGSQADRTDVFEAMPDVAPLLAERSKAERQAGTLGGGNHFIEFQVDDEGWVWGMVHTGSRNVGKLMAEHYDRIAREEDRALLSPVPVEWGLAHLPVESGAGQEYLEVLGWCLRFARENRRLVAEAAQRAVARRCPDADPGEPIDVHHNYAAIETHAGAAAVVHRKGAIRAEGPAAIPGSMGTGSFIAEGLAPAESFLSCGHGAGRAMGRREAARRLSAEEVLADLERRGVRLVKRRMRDVAEEAPQAYKDIERVMAEQTDLVRPVMRLRPIGVVKG